MIHFKYNFLPFILQSLGSKVYVQLYSPETPHADFNLLLIWSMAVGTLLAGAWWSGYVKYHQYVLLDD